MGLRRQRHFAGDGLGGPLHHKRQQHDMGLKIHYELATRGDEGHARKLVRWFPRRAEKDAEPVTQPEFLLEVLESLGGNAALSTKPRA